MGERSNVNLEFEYQERVSRLFIFRFLWVFVFVFPFYLLAIFVGFSSMLHFLYMFVMGRRQATMWGWYVRFTKWLMEWNSYLHVTIDQRPKFWW